MWGQLFAIGLQEENKTTVCKIYRIDNALKINDSSSVNIGRDEIEDYLQLNSDSLHGFLNIYLQKKDKKLVRILRFDKQLKLVADIPEVDIARLNSISAFENEIFYHGKDVYTIKVINTDSAGTQFYLNKWSLKSGFKNFEYTQTWQFPFEKKNIAVSHILMVNKKFVLLYVNVGSGPKLGQWLLKVNSTDGTLIRGTKINAKKDTAFYSFGRFYLDTVVGSVTICGQKIPATDFSFKENKLSGSKSVALLYLAEMDSTGEMTTREEFKIPVVDVKSQGSKVAGSYIFRVNDFIKTRDKGFVFELDIFKGVGENCFAYCNTSNYNLTLKDEKLMLEKNVIAPNPNIEKYYFNTDKLDMSGKICYDSLLKLEKIYYRNISLPVKMAFKKDTEGNPVWVLRKSDAKKGIENFSVLSPVKKIYQITKIEEINRAEQAVFYKVSDNNFILCRQVAGDKMQLKLFTW